MNSTLHEMFIEELRDIYDAEQQLVKTLPKLAKAAEADELREAFTSHTDQTQGHIERLGKVFESLNERPKRKKCEGMTGILSEGQEILKKHKGSAGIDAGLIAAAQKVEHYEMASYGTLSTWADLMGHEEAADLLKQILGEEKETDAKLTRIAEDVANIEGQEEMVE